MKKFKIKNSLRLYKKALEVLPAGVSSNARIWKAVCPAFMPCSIFVKKARGSKIWDVDGNKYIDYRLGFGPVILGHSHPIIRHKVDKAEENGLVYALSHELEAKVAKKMRSMVPCAEMVRFANSGTEATMHSIRVARAFTGREKIVKFEGHYHGAHDYVLFSTDPPFDTPIRNGHPIPHVTSEGIPKHIKDLVFVERWNDFASIEDTMEKHGSEIAAIITEPIMGNSGAIMPKPGYLRHLKKLCEKHGSILIFDEVKTGFRVAKGGAQELLGVKPHMATFAKSMGNGYPVAALTGIKEIMGEIGPHHVVHGGTYSSNPISLTAVDATLDFMNTRDVFPYLRKFGKELIHGVSDLLRDRKLDFVIQGTGSMFQVMFTDLKEVNEYRDLEHVDMNFYSRLHYELLKEGVMIDEDNEEVIFTSYAHTFQDLGETLDAFDKAIPRAIIPRTSIATLATRDAIIKKQ